MELRVNGPRPGVQGGCDAVDGIDSRCGRRIYGFPRPEMAPAVDHGPLLTTLLPPTAGSGGSPDITSVEQGADVRDSIGAAFRRPRSTPNLDSHGAHALRAALHGMSTTDRTKPGNELIEPGRPL